MKEPERNDLLEDLLPTQGAPELAAILAGVRRDRAARARRRTWGIAGAVTLGLALALFWQNAREPEPEPKVRAPMAAAMHPAAGAPPSDREIPAIPRLTDQELLASINHPSAIVTLPDGRKSLLVLMPPRAGRRQ